MCTLTFDAGRQSASALVKTKQPPRGFARRLPLELYPEDVDFSTALPVTVLSILYHPGRRLHHFNLGAHFLDLGGLLFELGCESPYLLLLLLRPLLPTSQLCHSAWLGAGGSLGLERRGLWARGGMRCATRLRFAKRHKWAASGYELRQLGEHPGCSGEYQSIQAGRLQV